MRHGKPRLHRDVGDGYTFVDIFVKINLTVIPIIFYGALLGRREVTIPPTESPIILVY